MIVTGQELVEEAGRENECNTQNTNAKERESEGGRRTTTVVPTHNKRRMEGDAKEEGKEMTQDSTPPSTLRAQEKVATVP